MTTDKNELLYYDENEEWERSLLIFNSVLKEITTKLEILNDEFKLTKQYNPIEHISSRIKSADSIARKLRKKQKELTVANILRYVNDVAGVRIICSFTSDIYQIADAIMRQNDVTVLKIKDYILNPKPNGYRSYHMIVTVPIFLSNEYVETKVEIQIRTIAMDFWASLEHKMYYKFDGKAPEKIKDELTDCARIISHLDDKMLKINEKIQNYNSDPTSSNESNADIIDISESIVSQEEVIQSSGTVKEINETIEFEEILVDDTNYNEFVHPVSPEESFRHLREKKEHIPDSLKSLYGTISKD